MIPVETVPGMGEGRDKGEYWRGEFTCIWYSTRTFVNVAMYPHTAQYQQKKKMA
jgi:hypothetical protein